MTGPTTADLAVCPRCELIVDLAQAAALPTPLPGGGRWRLQCPRCHAPIGRRSSRAAATPALALAALLLYPVAISLPVLRVERLGAVSDASVWSGGVGLISEGQVVVGACVLLASVLLPLLKLTALFLLSGGALRRRPLVAGRLLTWVDRAGRWSMLDVLLVAFLIAAVKLGQVLEFSAGPGALAFTTCVLLNLAASACFDPRSLWDDAPS